jgi:hypothetical protein
MAQELTGPLPDENTENQTYLDQHLFETFVTLSPEIQYSMLETMCSVGLRHVFGKRHDAIRGLLMNIVEADPLKHKIKYTLLRTELCLLEDILTFLDKGKEYLFERIQNQQPDTSSIEG